MKKLIITSIILLIIVVIGVFVIPQFFKKGLKESIAEALNTDPTNLILNLPPHPGRYPGSILLPHDNGYVVYEHSDRPEITNDNNFKITANLSQIGNYGGQSAGVLSGVFSNYDHFNVDLEITNGHIIELTVTELKHRIQNNSSVLHAINKRLRPIILNKVFEGIISYHISAKDEEGAKILAETQTKVNELQRRNEDISINGSVVNDRKISFSYLKPTVIAFEALEVNLVMNDLSGDEFDPILSPLSIENLEKLKSSNKLNSTPVTNTKSWGLITIGSGHFENLASNDVPEATKSAHLVYDFLNTYQPDYSKLLMSTEEHPITDDSLLDWSIDLMMDMSSNPVDYLVIYYTGHGMSLPNGELALLQGNVNKDFAEKALENLNPQIASPSDGIITAQTLYNSIEVSGIPFTLIIDACYPSDEMQLALNRVSMNLTNENGSLLVYTGDAAFITNEMDEVSDALWNLGTRFSYRTNNNPVIFSAKPGAKAVFKENPNSIYDMKLSPLAARIINYSNYYPIPSLSELILGIIDNKGGLGEVTLYGSVSWSNLDNMKAEIGNLDSSYTNLK